MGVSTLVLSLVLPLVLPLVPAHCYRDPGELNICGFWDHNHHYSLPILLLGQLCRFAFRTPLVFYISGGMFQYAISAVPFVGSCGRRIGAPLPWKPFRHRPFLKTFCLGVA